MRRILLRSISICILLSFFLCNLQWAEAKKKFSAVGKQTVEKDDVGSVDYSIPDISSFKILSKSGTIVDRFDSETGIKADPDETLKVVVHIQDMHCNYEAQSNIAKVITEMYKRFGFKLMLLEGASSRLDASFFNPFSKKVKEKVAKKYMQLGQITGPEYLLMAKSDDVQVLGYGIEDRDLYLEHLNAFQEYFKVMKDLNSYLGSVNYVINRLKEKIYSADLKNYEKQVAEFKDKKLGFKEYINLLSSNAKKYNVNISSFPNFQEFIRVMATEKKIDYKEANKQKDLLLGEVGKLLTSKENEKVKSKSLSFKRGFLTPAEFYRYLNKLVVNLNIDLGKYAQLKKYIAFITVSDDFTNAELFNEIENVCDVIKMGIAKSDAQKELVEVVKNLDILEQLASIKLTKDGLDYFEANKLNFHDDYFIEYVQRVGSKHKIKMPKFKDSTLIADSLPMLELFYDLAVKRDHALGENILRRMQEEDQDYAVVVTGGFHTDGIDKMLREQGISYVVVSPVVTKDYNEDLYYDVLTKPRPTINDIIDEAEQLEAQIKR